MLSTLVLSLFWILASTEETQLVTRNSTSVQNVSHSKSTAISSATSRNPSCNTGCYGSLDITVVYTGTDVTVFPAVTTGPPNCGVEALYIGPGYFPSEPEITLEYQEIHLSYSIDNGACTMTTDTPFFGYTRTIAPNLIVLGNDTVACPSTGYTTMSSYHLVSESLSDGLCTRASARHRFSTPIVFKSLCFLTTSLSKIYLPRSILNNMAVTTCDILINSRVSAPGVDNCVEIVYATMNKQAYWRGVQMTFDKKQVTAEPNCANALVSLGSGFTGSSSFTTISYENGGIDLGTGTEMFLAIKTQEATAPFNTDDIFLTTNSQTIGCLSYMHDVVKYFTIITTYSACSKRPRSIARTMTLSTPITDSGVTAFVSYNHGEAPVLVAQIATQLPNSNNPTLLVTSTAVSAPTSQWSLPPNSLNPLTEFTPALPQTTKIILVVTVGMAMALVVGFVAFFLWRRFSTSHEQRSKSVHASYAAIRSGSHESYIAVQQDVSQNDLPMQKQRSWRAPLMMLGGVIAGLAFAIGHYCFYSSLDQHPIDSTQISQSWVLRLGNLFAFAVKLSLAISIGVAFVQLQWVKLRQQPFRVKDIDALSGGLGNILSFTESLVWFRHPLIASIAVICWLLPIIPVVTPGTINVVSHPYKNETYLRVPQFSRNVSTWTANRNGDTDTTSSSILLNRIAWSTAIGGNILPIQFDHTNASYHLDFPGPAVQCIYANSTLTTEVSQALGRSLDDLSVGYQSYFSWVAGDSVINHIDDQSCRSRIGDVDTTSMDRARIYISLNDGNATAIPDVDIHQSFVNLTECALYNATYSVDFTFNNTQQLIVVRDMIYHNGISYPLSGDSENNATREYKDQVNAYVALMAMLGALLVGFVDVELTAASSDCTSIQLMDIDLNFDLTNTINSPNASEVLQRGIEELFRNMTISLLSKDVFIDNMSEPVLVNITVDLLTYNFISNGLVVAYGSAIIATIICSLLGFYAFLVNDGSYQNIFSTFVRATRNAEIILQDGDIGSDPCPKNVGQALIDLTTNRASSLQPISRLKKYLIPRKPVPTNQQDRLD